METQAIRGIRWTLLAYVGNRGLTLITTFVLARLLVPDDFGIVAFGAMLVAALSYFANLGLGPAVVVRQDLDREALGTAFSLLIAVNLAGAILVAALSPLAASLLGDAGSAGVIAALAVPTAIGGVTYFHLSLLQRELQFRSQFLCQTVQAVVTATVSVVLAALGAGVWSLVAGQIAGALAFTVALVAAAPYRVRPRRDPAVARTLWGSGRGFMLQSGFSFLEQNADYLVVGSTLGPRPLGLYSMSYKLCELPYAAVVDPVAQATFPGFARMRHRGEDTTAAFLMQLRLIVAIALPLGLLLSGAAEPFVEALLGPKWEGMIGMLAVLGLWGSLRTIHGTIGWFVNALGHSWYIGVSYAVMLTISVPVLIVAANEGGATGVAWVMVGNVVVMIGIVSTLAHRRAEVPIASQWAAVRPAVIAAVPAWGATAAVAAAAGDAAPLVALLAALAAGTAVYAAVLLAIEPRIARDAARQLTRSFAPTPAA